MSKIYVTRPGSLDDPSDTLDELKRWGADRLLRFRRVFGPRAKALVLPLSVTQSAIHVDARSGDAERGI